MHSSEAPRSRTFRVFGDPEQRKIKHDQIRREKQELVSEFRTPVLIEKLSEVDFGVVRDFFAKIADESGTKLKNFIGPEDVTSSDSFSTEYLAQYNVINFNSKIGLIESLDSDIPHEICFLLIILHEETHAISPSVYTLCINEWGDLRSLNIKSGVFAYRGYKRIFYGLNEGIAQKIALEGLRYYAERVNWVEKYGADKTRLLLDAAGKKIRAKELELLDKFLKALSTQKGISIDQAWAQTKKTFLRGVGLRKGLVRRELDELLGRDFIQSLETGEALEQNDQK